MFTLFRSPLPLFVLSGALLLSGAPVSAQTPAPPAAANAAAIQTPAPPTTAAAPTASAPEIPSWLTLAAILGAVSGLSGLGLAGFMFFQKSLMEKRLQSVAATNTNLINTLSSLEKTAVRTTNLEHNVCQLLGVQANPNEAPGFSLAPALKSLAWNQTHDYVAKSVDPRLDDAAQTATNLERFATRVTQHNNGVTESLAQANKSDEDLRRAFNELNARTRADLEAFVFNIYNLLFTQSEGDPVVPLLENRINRYETMLSELRRIQPDEITSLTMREFEETLGKLAQKLREARTALASARNVVVEPLPYLEEKDKGRAQILLEEQRKKMRGQTAGAKESLDALRDSAIELAKPLQTLWMGAAVPDPDRPERNERCRALLVHIESILTAAGIHFYEPQIGGELDTTKATHRFVGATHEAPFVVQKVTKIGLQVEDRVEPGAVVVA